MYRLVLFPFLISPVSAMAQNYCGHLFRQPIYYPPVVHHRVHPAEQFNVSKVTYYIVGGYGLSGAEVAELVRDLVKADEKRAERLMSLLASGGRDPSSPTHMPKAPDPEGGKPKTLEEDPDHKEVVANCFRCHNPASKEVKEGKAPVYFRPDKSIIHEGLNVAKMARAVRLKEMPPSGASAESRAAILGYFMFLPPPPEMSRKE